MAKRYTILASILGFNRQGLDLLRTLQETKCRPILLQYNSEPSESVKSIRFVQPNGRLSKFQALGNLLRLIGAGMSNKSDVLICINTAALQAGAVVKVLTGCELIYYSLEYSQPSRITKWIVKHFVAKYIDVEENRCQKFLSDCMAEAKPCMILHNMPHKLNCRPVGGKLRNYIKTHYPIYALSKIAVYAGSYQRYAKFENIIAAARRLPSDMAVVFMTYHLPKNLQKDLPQNCLVVPPQSGAVFYDWLADADLSLLPYEDASNFNVLNCSPQKIFDCFAVGVPLLGSKRPIIEHVLKDEPRAGVTIDYNEVANICKGIANGVFMKNDDLSGRMFLLHEDRFNVDVYKDVLLKFLEVAQ